MVLVTLHYFKGDGRKIGIGASEATIDYSDDNTIEDVARDVENYQTNGNLPGRPPGHRCDVLIQYSTRAGTDFRMCYLRFVI